MSTRKGQSWRHGVSVILTVLVMGWGAVQAVQDQLMAGAPKEGSILPTGEQDCWALAPVEPLTWSQPPVEKDPASKQPTYCGWGEPAYATGPLAYGTASWTFVADDFRCLGDVPVTCVRWWGSYGAWDGSEAPRMRPEFWRIGFWSHAAADSRSLLSRPNTLLWVIHVPAARVEERKADSDPSLQKSRDTIFEYLLKLQPQEYFRPDQFPVSHIQPPIFWLSITAVYTGPPGPVNPWVWRSRPRPWGGGAIRAAFKYDELRAGFVLDPLLALLVISPLAPDRECAYDMAFELATAPEHILWEQPLTAASHWANDQTEQSLVVEGAGTAVKASGAQDTINKDGDMDMRSGKPMDPAYAIEAQKSDPGAILSRIAADDWMCRSDQPLTGIVWWGSYIGSDDLPCESQRTVAPRPPDAFLLSIWSDEPGSDKKGAKTFSHPGRKLWEYRAGTFDEVLVGFNVYRYAVCLPQDRWFRPQGSGGVYWLSVVAIYKDARSIVYPWGWINHPSASWDGGTLRPLAHWTLDETAGRIAADRTGGHDGVLVGDPIWRPGGGWIGGAIDLDGRDDHIRVEPNRSAAEPQEGLDFAPGSFSVSTWIYPRQTRGQWHTILEHDRDGINRNRFGLWLDPEGRFHFRVGQNTWHSRQSIIPNQWTHLTAVFDADARTMNLYVNGILDGLAMDPKGFAAPYPASLIIGARGSADGEFFNGLIDDIRVFRNTLAAEDVLMLIGAGRNEGAVAGVSHTMGPETAPDWTLLLDSTRQVEDMSFLLFTQPFPRR